MTHLIIQLNIVVSNQCAQIMLAAIGMIIIQPMIILQMFLKVNNNNISLFYKNILNY